jgi:hypothetical protein
MTAARNYGHGEMSERMRERQEQFQNERCWNLGPIGLETFIIASQNVMIKRNLQNE